ncbi:MAG: AraC family transcriptional regulator, partial [Bacteroidota bacterium]
MSSYFIREVSRIKRKHFQNQAQIEVAIRTRKILDHQFMEKLSLEMIAEELGQSQYQLIRAFRRYYGMTPGKYLVDRRMIEA